jgi:hypothetical protein
MPFRKAGVCKLIGVDDQRCIFEQQNDQLIYDVMYSLLIGAILDNNLL